MLRTLITLDEEVVERSEQMSDGDREVSTRIKDAMRVESVQQIL